MKKYLLTVFSLMILTACGGGGGGSSNSPDNPTNSIKGQVIADMENYNAIVCYDRNANKICDIDEPSAKVSADGSYFIENTTDSDILNVSIVAEFRSKTVSPNTFTSFPSDILFIMESPKGKALVSSFTTMVKNIIDTDATYTLTQAENRVKTNIGTSAGADIYNADAYTDSMIKVNNLCASITEAFIKQAKNNGIELSPALITLLSNIIMEQGLQIVELAGNGAKNIEKTIIDENIITKEDVIATGEKIEQAKRAEKFNIENTPFYSFRLDHINNSVLYMTDKFLFVDNKTFKQSNRLPLEQYTNLVLNPEQTFNMSVNTSEAFKTPIKAKNMLDLYLKLLPDEYPNVDAFIVNYGKALAVKLSRIETNFPDDAEFISFTLTPTSVPSFIDVKSGNINHVRLRDSSIWFDETFQQDISTFDEAINSIQSWNRGGFLEVGHGKYSVMLQHNMNGIIQYHDSVCVAYNNYSRDNTCFRFSRVYKKFDDHIEILTDDDIVFIWFGKAIYGKTDFNAINSITFPTVGSLFKVTNLNENAIKYLSVLGLNNQ